MKNFFEKIFNFFFPYICPLCEKEIQKNKIICDECFEEIASLLIKEPFCKICGREKKYNHKCKNNFEFDEILGIFHYKGKILDLIHNYKYKRMEKLSKIILPFLINKIKNLNGEYDLIISVPLHPARKRERGFDQNEIFCKEISKMLNLPYMKNLIYRIKYNKPQAKIKDENKRIENVKGIFKRDFDFKNKRVILFDDILTTGATLNEISKILKENGAQKILALVIAIS